MGQKAYQQDNNLLTSMLCYSIVFLLRLSSSALKTALFYEFFIILLLNKTILTVWNCKMIKIYFEPRLIPNWWKWIDDDDLSNKSVSNS